MKRFGTILFGVGFLAAAGLAQAPNAQFKDISGKSYDLYKLLGEGKSVYMHVTATW